MSEVKFRSTAHRDFFLEMMQRCKTNDTYHRAFFYVMGIAGETRTNIERMFNFKEDCINPEGMHGGWQTSGTVRVWLECCKILSRLFGKGTAYAIQRKQKQEQS